MGLIVTGYQKMWNNLKLDIKMRMKEYHEAESVTGELPYEAEIELDTLEGIMQTMDQKEIKSKGN